jgi:hypothetical protein
MKAGRKLDVLIAEKLFNDIFPFQKFLRNYCRPLPDDSLAFEPCPHYSTDIKAAWKIVEKLLTMLPNQDFHIEHWADESVSGWQVSSCFELGKWKKWVKAKTLPHAICLAALKAIDK